MRRIYVSLLTAALLACLMSCEKVIHVEKDDTGMIYIHSMPGRSDTLRVDVTVTKSLFGDADVKYDKVNLSLEADGKSLHLVEDEDYGRKLSSGWSFYTTERLFSGQKLSLKADVEGISSVTAETIVPEGFPEVRIVQEKEYSFKRLPNHVPQVDRETVWTFHIDIDEDYADDQHFAVQVLRDSYVKWFGSDIPPESDRDHENGWTFYGMESIYGIPVGDTFTSLDKDVIIEINDEDFYIADNSGSGNVSFDVSVGYEVSHRLSGSYIGDVMQNESWLFHRYKVFIYRLSEECYNSLMTAYVNDNPGLASEVGLSPGIRTYTNIKGGLGMFGAVSMYESEWMEVKE